MASITGYGSKHSHEFTLNVWENSWNQASNSSDVGFSFTLYKNSYSWSGWNSISYIVTINGVQYTGTIPAYSAGNVLTITSGSLNVPHNSDGTKTLYFSFQVTDNSGQSYTCGNASASGYMGLTNIPRYPSVAQSLRLKTDTSITMNWSSDKVIDALYYSINGGTTWNYVSNPNSTNGTYVISNLAPNTSYTIKTRLRSRDSQLTGDSSNLSITTFDISKITVLNDFEHGELIPMTISSPANTTPLILQMYVGDVQIFQKNINQGNIEVQMTQDELDLLYSLYGSGQQLTAIFRLLSNGYTDEKSCLVLLKGNQKTIDVNVNNEFKRAKAFVNIAGTNKRGVFWYNLGGAWKRGGRDV